MTKKQMKETIKKQYMAAVYESKTAKRAYMQALNDGVEGLRKLSFRDDYVGKTQYEKSIADMILLLELANIEELQEWENMV